MIAKQVTVFLENKPGRLNEVTSLLASSGINISAFTIADTTDFGILRLMVADPVKTVTILKQNRFPAQLTDVVLINSPNEPGSLNHVLTVLAQEDVFIEYMYAFSVNDKMAVIVIRPTDLKRCADTLMKHRIDQTGYETLQEK